MTPLHRRLGVGVIVVAAFVVAVAGRPAVTDRPAVGTPVPGVAAIVNASAPDDDLYFSQFCAAVAVASTRLLTAAHCVRDLDAEQIHVVIGADNLCRSAAIEGRRHQVVRIDIHPEYDAASARFDLALLAIEGRIEDPAIRRVSSSPVGPAVATAVGWGRQSVGGRAACQLTRVDLSIQDDGCATIPNGRRMLDPTAMLCAVSSGPNTCTGDSGGPLFEGTDLSSASVLGVVSWGPSCAAGTPGLYARADLLADFGALAGDGPRIAARPTMPDVIGRDVVADLAQTDRREARDAP